MLRRMGCDKVAGLGESESGFSPCSWEVEMLDRYDLITEMRDSRARIALMRVFRLAMTLTGGWLAAGDNCEGEIYAHVLHLPVKARGCPSALCCGISSSATRSCRRCSIAQEQRSSRFWQWCQSRSSQPPRFRRSMAVPGIECSATVLRRPPAWPCHPLRRCLPRKHSRRRSVVVLRHLRMPLVLGMDGRRGTRPIHCGRGGFGDGWGDETRRGQMAGLLTTSLRDQGQGLCEHP